MLYQKPLASYWSPTALKRPDRSKQCHCLQFAKVHPWPLALLFHTEFNILVKLLPEQIRKVVQEQ